MISSTTTRPSKPGFKLPCLMNAIQRHDLVAIEQPLVVLVTEIENGKLKGVAVTRARSYAIGENVRELDVSGFEPFDGDVTLRNSN